MTANVGLRDQVPIVVSPRESFILQVSGCRFQIESGSGYPGAGGVFFGKRGRCFLSSLRLVYVEEENPRPFFMSFSLPLYAIQSWHFKRPFLYGLPSWNGVVSQVPRGGLVSQGRFKIEFFDPNFEDFVSIIEPLLASSRELAQEVQSMNVPSIVQLGCIETKEEEEKEEKKFAFQHPSDPFKVYISRSL